MSDQELLVEIRKALNVNPDCHCDCADCEEYREHRLKFKKGFIQIPVTINDTQVTWTGTSTTGTITGGWTTSATTVANTSVYGGGGGRIKPIDWAAQGGH
jgi:hypothetical protein